MNKINIFLLLLKLIKARKIKIRNVRKTQKSAIVEDSLRGVLKTLLRVDEERREIPSFIW